MNETRDERVGAALRGLLVPDHRPGFWEDLERRTTTQPRRTDRRLGWLSVAATVAAVALVAGALMRTGDGEVAGGPDVPGAISGEIRVRGEDPDGLNPWKRWGFTLRDDGSFRVQDLDSPVEMTAFDARTRVQRSIHSDRETGETSYTERVGLASPPAVSPWIYVLDTGVGASVAALVAQADPRVTETVHEGREAWHLTADLDHDFPEVRAADSREIVVDKRTRFPLLRIDRLRGSVVDEWRATVTEAAAPDHLFTMEFPPGAQVSREDAGFRPAQRSDLSRSISGYEPVEPSWLPEGFELVSLVVGSLNEPGGPEGMNPPMHFIAQMTYRRGWDQVVVTTWSRRPSPARSWSGYLPGPEGFVWDDPISAGELVLEDAEAVALSWGPAGHTVGDIHTTPRLFAVGDDDEVVFTVSGPLPRADLVRIAESLRPVS